MSNNTKRQATLLWVLAVIVTLSSVIYQRKTGPTYPVKGAVEHNGKTVSYFFPRSQNTGENAEIDLGVSLPEFNATLTWKRLNSSDTWRLTPFLMVDGHLKAYLPSQPPAGKVQYKVTVLFPDGQQVSLTDEPVVIRFKGAVPAAVLIPHIFFMFTAMLLATRTGLAAFVDSPYALKYTYVTAFALMIGGLMLGPLVQKYAFDAYWTGWPWGHDLTDNKTIIAFLSWALAIWRYRRTGSARSWMIAAAIITLAIYLIPHSAFGSELNYNEMES